MNIEHFSVRALVIIGILAVVFGLAAVAIPMESGNALAGKITSEDYLIPVTSDSEMLTSAETMTMRLGAIAKNYPSRGPRR